MIVELFHMMFGSTPKGRGGWLRALDWVFTLAVLTAGSVVLRQATSGRDYPWSTGRMFFASALLWIGAMRARSGLSIISSGRARRTSSLGSCRG